MNSPQPSVNKELNTRFLPVVTPLGFAAERKGLYSRVVGHVFQFVTYKVETRLRREFIMEYGALYLRSPHEFINLEFGGTFPKKWYPAGTEEHLCASVTQVVEFYERFLHGWFQCAASEKGFLEAFLSHVNTKGKNASGYSDLTLACLYAVNADSQKAEEHGRLARISFRKAYDDFPSREWARKYAGYCDAFLARLPGGEVMQLLDEWSKLSLEKITPKSKPEQNKADAPNPAMTSLFQSGRHRRRVGDVRP
jgi:hypothetical protein